MSKIVALANRSKRVTLAAAFVFGTTLLLGSPSSASPREPGFTVHMSFGTLSSVCGEKGDNFKVASNGGYACEKKDGTGLYCTGKGVCSSGPAPGTPYVKRSNGTAHPPSSAGAASSAQVKHKVALGIAGRVHQSRIHKH